MIDAATASFNHSAGDALVVGASRGIGLALAHALAGAPLGPQTRTKSGEDVTAQAPVNDPTPQPEQRVRRLFVTHRGSAVPETLQRLADQADLPIIPLTCDVTNDDDLSRLDQQLGELDARLLTVIHAAGILHEPGLRPEKALSQLNRGSLQRVFDVNAFAPILLARAVLGHVPKRSPAHFAALSAMVGSIGDNHIGGWYAYRASKSALNQLLKTLAIECRRTHPGLCVTSIHPGTTDTGLSKPFQGNVPPGKLYSPGQSAERILSVIFDGDADVSGRFMNWDGKPLPW